MDHPIQIAVPPRSGRTPVPRRQLAGASLAVGLALGLLSLAHPGRAAESAVSASGAEDGAAAKRLFAARVEDGKRLFERNCAHCHGEDARGDEGPSLYELRKSDARIRQIIQEGIKGEMPKFGSKFNEAEVTALIAFLRTLKT